MEWKKVLLTISSLVTLTGCQLYNKESVADTIIQAPLKGKKVCVIGDSGTGSSDQLLVARALEKEICHYIFHTGDIIYPRGINSPDAPELKERFFAPYENLLRTTPFFLSMGNHDHRQKTQVWKAIAKNHENIIFPHNFYNIRFEDACLTIIDTVLNYRKGQDQWLKELHKKNDCDFKIALGHHPLFSSGHHGNARAMIKKFLSRHVEGFFNIYFAGHDHQLSIEKQNDKTTYVISGAAAKVRYLKNEKQSIKAITDLGYITFTLNELDFVLDLIRVKSNGDRENIYSYKHRK